MAHQTTGILVDSGPPPIDAAAFSRGFTHAIMAPLRVPHHSLWHRVIASFMQSVFTALMLVSGSRFEKLERAWFENQVHTRTGSAQSAPLLTGALAVHTGTSLDALSCICMDPRMWYALRKRSICTLSEYGKEASKCIRYRPTCKQARTPASPLMRCTHVMLIGFHPRVQALFPKSGHVRHLQLHPDEYREAVLNFIQHCVKRARNPPLS